MNRLSIFLYPAFQQLVFITESQGGSLIVFFLTLFRKWRLSLKTSGFLLHFLLMKTFLGFPK